MWRHPVRLSTIFREIGRAARDTEIQGIAATDYHERDFYYMKRLHQTGNIAQEQLVLILRKLMEVYRMKGEKPEIMVSLSDFEFVVNCRVQRTSWSMKQSWDSSSRPPCFGWKTI